MEINWDLIRHAGDHIMPDSFPAYDEDGVPCEDSQYLYRFPYGTRVVDPNGNRFLIMGAGAMQGTLVLRDRYRRMFYVDSDMRMKSAR